METGDKWGENKYRFHFLPRGFTAQPVQLFMRAHLIFYFSLCLIVSTYSPSTLADPPRLDTPGGLRTWRPYRPVHFLALSSSRSEVKRKSSRSEKGVKSLTSGAGGGGAGDVGRGRMVGAEARGRWTWLWDGQTESLLMDQRRSKGS